MMASMQKAKFPGRVNISYEAGMLGNVRKPESSPGFFNLLVGLTKDFTSPINLFRGFGKFYS